MTAQGRAGRQVGAQPKENVARFHGLAAPRPPTLPHGPFGGRGYRGRLRAALSRSIFGIPSLFFHRRSYTQVLHSLGTTA